MHAHCGSSLSLRSSHGHLHVSCVRWALLLISSISPFISSPSLSSLWSPCCSYCPTTSTSLLLWINTLRTSAEDLGTLAENESPTCILQKHCSGFSKVWLHWCFLKEVVRRHHHKSLRRSELDNFTRATTNWMVCTTKQTPHKES